LLIIHCKQELRKKIKLQIHTFQTVLSGTVWQNMGMAIDLKNVTIELVTSHDQGPDYPESSLAKLDFISSTFRFDSFSNQAKDIDLVSHEIVVSDTRYRGNIYFNTLTHE
jgi:hypothetical protein